ncbi:hypothetical protein G7Y89_g5123 [Cudoniella acicularis]|uniref:ATP phosphoribosyltransferase n=1 Tax=Cudoniella acicularis TaxID=354080 RepID=A0A8H4W6S4_9HELO|nr:hypothetical protein G7Y89_g5123 [Cudoniella acicularis]
MATAKFRLVFFAPVSALEGCKAAIFAAGDAANPHIGSVGKLEHTEEARLEVICFGEDVARKVVKALKMPQAR